MIFSLMFFLGSSERTKVEPTGNDAIQFSRNQRSPRRPRNEPQAGIIDAGELSHSELH